MFQNFLKDEKFRKRHPVIQQFVYMEKARSKYELNAINPTGALKEFGTIIPKDMSSIHLPDLMDSKTRSETVRTMTDFFLKNGMDVNQVDNLFSEMKMTAISRAEEVGREGPAASNNKER